MPEQLQSGDAPDEVRLMEEVDDDVRGRGVRVKYGDSSEGILWDSEYGSNSDATVTVVG